ncbi:MAG: SDR family NAD(P)-dependent oxidoreductase [Synoicihabitans sp.]
MSNAWSERVAIITGGAAGLGLATAQRLAADGVRVALFDARADALNQAKHQLGKNAQGCLLDVTDERAAQSAVDQVISQWGRVDILINSAGITGLTSIKTHEVPMEDFSRVMAVNVHGPMHLFKAVAPSMLAANYGRVLNVASIAGKDGNAGMASYSASKAAVIGLTKSQGKEYADTGITINAIAPAVVRTEIVAAMPDDQVEYMTARIPMGRCGTVEEFASLAQFVVSADNSFTTGFCYDLTGGRAVY